jgi:hypothetical protein
MLGCSVTSVKNVELLLLYIAPFSRGFSLLALEQKIEQVFTKMNHQE